MARSWCGSTGSNRSYGGGSDPLPLPRFGYSSRNSSSLMEDIGGAISLVIICFCLLLEIMFFVFILDQTVGRLLNFLGEYVSRETWVDLLPIVTIFCTILALMIFFYSMYIAIFKSEHLLPDESNTKVWLLNSLSLALFLAGVCYSGTEDNFPFGIEYYQGHFVEISYTNQAIRQKEDEQNRKAEILRIEREEKEEIEREERIIHLLERCKIDPKCHL